LERCPTDDMDTVVRDLGEMAVCGIGVLFRITRMGKSLTQSIRVLHIRQERVNDYHVLGVERIHTCFR